MVTLYRSAELYPLQSLLVPLGIRHADLQDMEQDIKLKIAFPLSVSHLQRAPSRQLHIPRRLEELTGMCFAPVHSVQSSSGALIFEMAPVETGGSRVESL